MKASATDAADGLPGLIRWDGRTRAVLAVLVAAVALATAFEIHGSSIGLWSRILRDPAVDDGLLLGTPRRIRTDEWAVTTLAMISQARSDPPFPVENHAWGPERVPLIFNLPSAHWSMSVRPQYLGFFALDLERGFAFYWAMKGLLLVGGSFLLLLSLTNGHFGVSLLGAAWILFSGYVQWWYSTPAMLPETVGSVALGIVAAHGLLLSPGRIAIALSAIALCVFTLDGALSFYPPFQIPLLQLALAITLGSLAPRLASDAVRVHFRLRLFALLAVALAVGGALFLYYTEAKATIDLMRGTVYPGQRASTGGDVSLVRVFGGFFGPFMGEGRFPKPWHNVCEASNFVLLFPVSMAALAERAWRGRGPTAIEWALLAYLLLSLAWTTLGFPAPLAAATGFAWAPPQRVLLGLGLASILLCCVTLADRADEAPVGRSAGMAFAAIFAAGFLLFARAFNLETDDFASTGRVAAVCAFATAAGVAMFMRWRLAFAVLVLAPQIWSHALVNPVAKGLDPILESKSLGAVRQIVERDPGARWLVFGSDRVADLMKTTGAYVVNGTMVVPPLDDLARLDPRGVYESLYNRYAHVQFLPASIPGVHVSLRHGDAYTIRLNPLLDLWRPLDVRYVALPVELANERWTKRASLVLESSELGLWIYELRD